ncbi:hypothetical protein T265_03998 [Opisthorchis viverrini]|uniref:Uncharacterized protein n=1 Tax=Opisthorchis viverrini TaxID=6198 RepID=A0A075A1B0_OPIVI|nr:hypothetical protein T265_03998 [Opisthorchis viverrini]KER29335.1 hypothetical protein T265_03998 [Opisthorchis viverrini]
MCNEVLAAIGKYMRNHCGRLDIPMTISLVTLGEHWLIEPRWWCTVVACETEEGPQGFHVFGCLLTFDGVDIPQIWLATVLLNNEPKVLLRTYEESAFVSIQSEATLLKMTEHLIKALLQLDVFKTHGDEIFQISRNVEHSCVRIYKVYFTQRVFNIQYSAEYRRRRVASLHVNSVWRWSKQPAVPHARPRSQIVDCLQFA